MSQNWKQETLTSEHLILLPLEPSDFEAVYLPASDPLVWEQHPNPNRYQRGEFTNYFEGAVQSGGAYKICTKDGQVIGCTRYYDYDPADNSILIGYTFIGRPYWGKGLNQELKKLMVDHAFQHVDIVRFHIGATNFRSQKSIEKFGAVKTDELVIAYYGEAPRTNFVYEIKKPMQRLG